MRIALVEDGIYPFDHGGHEVRVHYLVKHLARTHEVTLFVQEKKNVDYPDNFLGAKVREVPCFVKNEHLRLPLGSLVYAKNVAPMLDSLDFDVIDVPFFSLGFQTDAKIVATYGAFLARWREALGPRAKLIHFLPLQIQKYLSIKKLKMADETLSLSDLSYQEALKLGSNPEHTCVVKNGVDEELFKPIPEPGVREEFGIEAESNLLLYAGRLHEEKGVLDALRAYELSEEADYLLITGKGPLRPKILKTINRRGLEGVILTGEQSYEDMPRFYSAADAFIFPSWFEIQPLACLEAMACRTPVIASDIQGVREMVEDGHTGLLFHPNDEKNMVDRVDTLLKESHLKEELTENALEFARERTWKKISQQTVEVYR